MDPEGPMLLDKGSPIIPIMSRINTSYIDNKVHSNIVLSFKFRPF